MTTGYEVHMYRHIEMMATALEQMRRDGARIADSLELIANSLKHPPRERQSIQDFVDQLEQEGLPKPTWVGLMGAAPGINLLGEDTEDGQEEAHDQGGEGGDVQDQPAPQQDRVVHHSGT